MKFSSPEEREAIVALSPVGFEGNTITIERHEEADNRFYAFYRVYAEVAVVDFPLEHWEEDSAREALAAMGNVCCLDPLCFDGGDNTSIRAVLRLDHHRELPEQLLVRNHDGPACLCNVHLVRTWIDAGPEPEWGEYDFGNGPELHSAPAYHPVGNPPTQLPPNPQSLVATILEWESIVPTPPLRPVRTRQPTPYPRHQTGEPATLLCLPSYGIGGVPAVTPSALVRRTPPALLLPWYGTGGVPARSAGDADYTAPAPTLEETSAALLSSSSRARLPANVPSRSMRAAPMRGGPDVNVRVTVRANSGGASGCVGRRNPGLSYLRTRQRVQHAKFDFSGASRRLRNVLSKSYLVSPEFHSSDDTESLLDIAAACGATEEEAAMIDGGVVAPPSGA
jgi:hypothetical protein